jgi:hypothetical protein
VCSFGFGGLYREQGGGGGSSGGGRRRGVGFGAGCWYLRGRDGGRWMV